MRKATKTTTFWQSLPKPFFVLAPMANVTDSVFRKIITKYGKPDVMWTEFVSADGLCSPAGRDALIRDLEFTSKERPIVAQLFTGHPVAMRGAAQLCAELGFDGIDINMGCPDRSVEKQGGGAAMIRDPKSALAVIQAAHDGIRKAVEEGNAKRMIPVTVKTRIGYNRVEMDWLRTLLEQKLPALTVHLRTRKEMSDVPAHWELMPEIDRLRDTVQADMPPMERTLIIGNGDVMSLNEGAALVKKSSCDGVMIGRGIFGTPWLFGNATSKSPRERLEILLEHTKLFEKTFCGRKRHKNFAVMKKHFKAYVNGWPEAKQLRAKLMETDGYKGVKKVIDEYLTVLK